MNYADRAPARQPVSERRGDHLAVSPEPEAAPQDHGNTVAHLRLLWENRRLLFRAALIGLALGLAIASELAAQFGSPAFFSRKGRIRSTGNTIVVACEEPSSSNVCR